MSVRFKSQTNAIPQKVKQGCVDTYGLKVGLNVGLKVGDNDLKVDKREYICVNDQEHVETDGRTSFQGHRSTHGERVGLKVL